MSPPSFDSILNPTPTPTPTPNPLVVANHANATEEDSSVPFETALQRLSATLNEAVSFFNQLDHSFKEDTRSITLYAKSPVLDKIWRSKVAAVRQSHHHHYQRQQRQQEKANSRFQRSKSRFITSLLHPGKKQKRNTNTGINTGTGIAHFHLHDYIKRIEKDLLEAICARWPAGIKHGLYPISMTMSTTTSSDANSATNMALVSLGFMYDRMTTLADRLQMVGSVEVQARYSAFRGLVWEVELLQISMRQNGEFWW